GHSQIKGDFENRKDIFDIGYAAYWNDHLETFFRSVISYSYHNLCYISGPISNQDNLFRSYKLDFCRDTGMRTSTVYWPLSEPCYRYSGPNTTVCTFLFVGVVLQHMFWLGYG